MGRPIWVLANIADADIDRVGQPIGDIMPTANTFSLTFGKTQGIKTNIVKGLLSFAIQYIKVDKYYTSSSWFMQKLFHT